MRMQRIMRRNGRLDDSRKSHGGIAAAGLESRPAGRRQRGRRGARRMAPMILRQQQPGGVHVSAGNMRVNIDGAGHDDLAGDVVDGVRRLALRRRDDPIAAYPYIAHSVSPAFGIDDATAGKAYQHPSLPFVRFWSMRPMISETRGASLGLFAWIRVKVPISRAYSMPSWSFPGQPTSIFTRGG